MKIDNRGCVQLGRIKFDMDHGPALNRFKTDVLNKNPSAHRDYVLSRITVGEVISLLGMSAQVQSFAIKYGKEIGECGSEGIPHLAQAFVSMLSGVSTDAIPAITNHPVSKIEPSVGNTKQLDKESLVPQKQPDVNEAKLVDSEPETEQPPTPAFPNFRMR